MGMSYTNEVANTLAILERRCRALNSSSNTWTFGSTEHFFELERREYPSGAVRGMVFAIREDGTARRVGRFYINPEGKVETGSPISFRALWAEARFLEQRWTGFPTRKEAERGW